MTDTPQAIPAKAPEPKPMSPRESDKPRAPFLPEGDEHLALHSLKPR